MDIVVLRLGHRPERDQRATTHVALTARAFCASGVLVSRKDEKIEGVVRDVVDRFGGSFSITTGVDWKKEIREWKRKGGIVVHLTMYGVPPEYVFYELLRRSETKDRGERQGWKKTGLMVVVGAEKVPAGVYQMADFNVSIGNQPHSEISSLAVFLSALNRLFDHLAETENGHGIESRDLWEMAKMCAPPDLEVGHGGRRGGDHGGKCDFGGAVLRVLPNPRGKTVVDYRRTKVGEWVPSRDEAVGLLYLHRCPPNVIQHIMAVEKVARKMGELAIKREHDVDMDILVAGAVLHDIGRAKTHSPAHAIEGAGIVEKEGVHRRVVDIVRCHLGAGVDEEDARALGFPPGRYMPVSIEEKIVAHADNLIDDTRCASLKWAVNRFKEAGLGKAADRIIALHRELEDVIGVDPEVVCREVLENGR